MACAPALPWLPAAVRTAAVFLRPYVRFHVIHVSFQCQLGSGLFFLCQCVEQCYHRTETAHGLGGRNEEIPAFSKMVGAETGSAFAPWTKYSRCLSSKWGFVRIEGITCSPVVFALRHVPRVFSATPCLPVHSWRARPFWESSLRTPLWPFACFSLRILSA